MALRSDDLRPIVTLAERYRTTRAASPDLVRTLETEDYVVQSMPSVSPTKWHLAHTTWFFERFILQPRLPGYELRDDRYHFLFNSYYYTQGDMHARASRGLLARPTVAEIRAYRDHVDEHMLRLIDDLPDAETEFLVTLGIHHEQQHQELMLTDIKHVLSCNPCLPAFTELPPRRRREPLPPIGFVALPGGRHDIGVGDRCEETSGFCFDNETPRHSVWLEPCRLADRLVTNGEYRDFIDAGGYAESAHWLADGWAWVNADAIDRPLYWSEDL
ncbi:MAG: DinB family protein, partial [Gammaproteobacteria bacterium]